jgi:hypothetical protein
LSIGQACRKATLDLWQFHALAPELGASSHATITGSATNRQRQSRVGARTRRVLTDCRFLAQPREVPPPARRSRSLRQRRKCSSAALTRFELSS